MVRNDYRRAFIMLRAAMPGYGGHVRLERRTLTGSLYFIVTAPQGVGELSAALAGQQNGETFAAPIGPLARDRRGQLALAWQFDPRNIQGRPLEAYAWVVVVATGGPCAVALTGNVEGSRNVDAAALSRAVCALFAPAEAPAAELPAPGELLPREERAAPETAAPEPPPEEAAQGDIKIYTLSRTRLRQRERRRLQEREETRSGDGQTPRTEESAPEALRVESVETDCPAPEALPNEDAGGSSSQPSRAEAVTAAQRLGLDITRPWPGEAEGLRRLFATQAPAEVPWEDGYTYVHAPLPRGAGFDGSLAGLKAENGAITALRYALPARRTPEPPPGLEDCAWQDGEGEMGYWTVNAANPAADH